MADRMLGGHRDGLVTRLTGDTWVVDVTRQGGQQVLLYAALASTYGQATAHVRCRALTRASSAELHHLLLRTPRLVVTLMLPVQPGSSGDEFLPRPGG